MRQVEKDDIVRYSGKFLRSMSIYTGELCFITGRVLKVLPFVDNSGKFVLTVEWSNGITSRILSSNVSIKGVPEHE